MDGIPILQNIVKPFTESGERRGRSGGGHLQRFRGGLQLDRSVRSIRCSTAISAGFFGGAVSAVGDVAGGVVNAVGDAVSSVANAVGDFFGL